jgi:MraZ protein
MFHGTFEHTIDEKGRVNVPVKFRDHLRATGDDRLFFTNFIVKGVKCLDVYPYAAWVELESRLREKPQFDPNVIDFFHNYYFAGAHECQLDKQGRVLVPPLLRQYASLKRDVMFTGALAKFRLWDRDAWAPVFRSGEQLLMENPSFLGQIGI